MLLLIWLYYDSEVALDSVAFLYPLMNNNTSRLTSVKAINLLIGGILADAKL